MNVNSKYMSIQIKIEFYLLRLDSYRHCIYVVLDRNQTSQYHTTLLAVKMHRCKTLASPPIH